MLAAANIQFALPANAGIEGYDGVIVNTVLEGVNNPVPLNFLSSLLKGNLTEDKRVADHLLTSCKTEEDAGIVLQILQIMKMLQK